MLQHLWSFIVFGVKWFFNANNVFFVVWGYPMSYLEFVGTIFNALCVILVACKKISTWWTGLVGVILFMSLFYQFQLFSDMLEQVYFLFTSVFGWIMWIRYVHGEDKYRHTNRKENKTLLAILVIGTAIFAYCTSKFHIWMPQWFPIAATFVFFDALTTIMSFIAEWLLCYKIIEAWYFWIMVDVIGIWLYWARGLKFVSLLYLLFLYIAIKGLFKWLKTQKAVKQNV